ncbi:MAG: hypothetical protein ACR5LC_11695 [Symbiopectobacterium sp.]|uniref:hypothetical protein n=1 Tax=Symbiopectobacterium sp. TaxID=2952789 RepID=UPI003F325774
MGFIWPETQADSLSVIRKLSTPESLPVLDADLFFVFMRSEKPAVTQLYRTWTAHPLW